MKKLIVCLLTVTMILGLTACGNNSVRPNGMRGRDGGMGGNRGNGAGSTVDNDEDVQAVIDSTKDKFEQLTYEDKDTGITLEYSLYSPETTDGEVYPMIMFIPDATSSGKTAKEIVEQYYGADIWASDEEQQKHASYVLVPAFSETVVDDNYTVSNQVEAAVNLINELKDKYPIDENRLYTTGQSMGCMTSLYLNSKYPDLFAASMFVSGQWDISVLEPLKDKKFFYITAGGDEKASGGQDEVMNMLDNAGVSYSYGTWSAKLDSDDQVTKVKELLNEGNSANMIRFEAGTVLSDNGGGMEHMASFNYGYKLTAVRDWLYEQTLPSL